MTDRTLQRRENVDGSSRGRLGADHSRGRRAAGLLAALCLTLALALGACGEDDAAAPGPGAEPGSTATTPAGDGPVVSPPLEPAPGDVTPPELPVNDDPSAVQCTGPPQGVFDATALVGEPIAAAAEAAEAEGCSVRVVERDGRALAVTEDFRPDRINVAVRDGVVAEISGLG